MWEAEGWGCWWQHKISSESLTPSLSLCSHILGGRGGGACRGPASPSSKRLSPEPHQALMQVPQASSLRCHSCLWDPNQVDPTPLLSVRGCKWGPTPQSSYTIHYYCITTAFLLHFYRVIAKLLPFCLMKVYYYQLLPNTSIITVLRILFTFEKISLYR